MSIIILYHPVYISVSLLGNLNGREGGEEEGNIIIVVVFVIV